MSKSSPKNRRNSIKRLIESLADQEPPFSSLGTPFLVDNEVTEVLVGMGQAAVPALVEALRGRQPKVAMYAAYCLGQMGDLSIVPALLATREKYLMKEPKEEYDFGVMSAVDRAIERLQE
ncbi:MAG TPA: hypothetical protein VGE45_16645 [Chloroflexia bacterium]|jgi:HEAT repeat protein